MSAREEFEKEQEQYSQSKFIDMFLAPTAQFLVQTPLSAYARAMRSPVLTERVVLPVGTRGYLRDA
eukprot:3940875-Rhodomonas_salina.4